MVDMNKVVRNCALCGKVCGKAVAYDVLKPKLYHWACLQKLYKVKK
jgi:hypothetical protein